ncbi:MAG TPA: hypothetical protein VGP61_00350 [Gemmatimonadales bacterium]|jgi:hypothetical protein|nr:hypothetical protein [Gemmatimonadales bacterium]
MRVLVLAASLSGLGALLATHNAPPSRQTRPVLINVTCAGPDVVNILINPWSRDLNEGDVVELSLNANANTEQLTLEPKDPNDWLFDDPFPYAVSKATPKQLTQLKGTVQKGHAYGYTLTATCKAGDGPAKKIVIDPDMVVH